MRKKFFRTLIAAAAMACTMSLPAFAESATVTGDYVNIRTGPGTGYGVVECLRKGAELTVTDRSNSSWYAVDYYGITGFMASGYLSVAEEEIQVETPVYDAGEETEAYINAMYVRFRSGPGSDYSILGEYNKGKAVRITGTYGEWYACTIDGRDGYIHSSYISEGTYSAPSYSYTGSADIYLDSFIPSAEDEYLVAEPTERPVMTPVPVHTPVPVPTAIPVPTSVPVQTPVPVETEQPEPEIQQPENQEAVRGYINANYVRFRSGPSTGYSIIDSYNKGTSLVITGTVDSWTACEINGISGYVFSPYVTRSSEAAVTPPVIEQPEEEEVPVQTPEPTAVPVPTPTSIPVEEVEETPGYVSGNSVRMRAEPNMSSDIITELNFGNRVSITGYAGDWTAVVYEGEPGFIYSQYVQEGEYSIPVQPETPEWSEDADSSELGSQIANYALQFVGYNYCWGGKDPSTGFDCSGLVYYVYGQFGYTLNRVADDQARNGVHVDELQPGDILCFYSGSSYIGHVGIYIGDGMFVHAQNSATGVVISSLDGYYGARGYEARRIV